MAFERREFLLALAAAGVAVPALRATAQAAGSTMRAGLVLSGGGARGAYQAGVVGALAARLSVPDGTAIAPYDLCCGTSIGALNGWCVATAQYTRMRQLWYGIGAEPVIQLKPEFSALRDPESGVLNWASAGVNLLGLLRDKTGILRSQPVLDWIARNVDPATPLVMPLVWAVTNLTRQRPEYFFIDPRERTIEERGHLRRALTISVGPQTVIREATPEILHRALFASAAIPLAFDPVMMPGPDGKMNAYCDGGVAANSPISIAHALADAADVILLDPPFESDYDYSDALEIAFGAFGTVQRNLLELEMRNAYFQSTGKRALSRLTAAQLATITAGDEQLQQYVKSIPTTTLRYLRPQKTLPVTVVGFDDVKGIGEAYRVGWLDAAGGFSLYDWKTFAL
ncbi:MAG TPA: patatin-like phospholipase family protein [Candidatus Nitrosotalea sp.]|nr:patatin-like phospholipase family protein [Candidatus Nitrosotalea sp.]